MSDIINTVLDQSSIANRAMLFRLSRGAPARRVRDEAAEALVKQQLGDEGQIVSRELFSDKTSLIYQYRTLDNEMYNFHIKATLPYGDDQSRLLPNAQYFEYTTRMQGFISQLEQMKQQIVATWSQMVQHDVAVRNARLMGQGKHQTAAVADYPTVAQIEHRLYVNWYAQPIATSGDFRFSIPQDMVERLDAQIADAVAAAGRDLYVRMLKPVSAFVEKLGKFTGDKGQRWHDSFIDNLNALSRELAPLNVNDDPEVAKFLGEIEAIVKPYAFNPSVLKEDDAARAAMKAKLEALEGRLRGYAI